jgi:hypothetical protein
MHDRHMDAEQPEQRSLGATIAAAAVTGSTPGAANATTGQIIDALRRPKDEPPPSPKKS